MPKFLGSWENSAPLAVTATPFTATSTAAIPCGGGSGSNLLNLLASQNCYIRFGDASVSAATALDWYLPANEPVQYRINKAQAYFRVIRASADGVLDSFISGQAT